MAFTFNGDEGEMIDPKVAQAMIDRYQKDLGTDDTKAEFFGFRKINQLFAQGNAMGIRIYLGKDDKGLVRMIVVGAGADGKNIAPLAGNTQDGLVLEWGDRCPPYCPTA
jgi:hypothetical protein